MAADLSARAAMIDFHVHFFPERLFGAIWRVFEGPEGYWPIRYRLHGDALVDFLRAEGVERFVSLVYAHKPGTAAYLNDFVAESAARFPELVPFGTVYAGDADPLADARRCIEGYGFYGLKLQPAVSQEMPDDPRLFPIYELLQARGRMVLCHSGSAPQGWMFDGPERLRRVMERFPKLRFIVAHCGAAEYEGFAAVAADYPSVYFDTAMISVPCEGFAGNCPGAAFYQRFQDRILFGSDFPNIPYEYHAQAAGIRALGLEAPITAKIFAENANKLLESVANTISGARAAGE
jgi:predicted TIM-barrel fold metal-dependent hydrolase